MNALDHTKTHAHRALIAARRLLLRFYDTESHTALAILAEIRHLAVILSRTPNPRALRRTEGRIYTAMQAAHAGRTRLSRKSFVFLAEGIFHRMKQVAQAMNGLPLARTACRNRIETLLARTGDLLLLLEHQMTAVSAAGRYRCACAFASLADSIREDAAKCRIAVLAEPSETGHHTELTLLQAVGDLLDSAGSMAYSVLGRGLRPAGKGDSGR
ncbi:MAG: hypothetical protein ACYC2I_05565 [Elusimicrobiales bacterium]